MTLEPPRRYSGTEDQTLVTPVTIPIIFLPGIMGSRLKFRSGRKWDSDHRYTSILPTWVLNLMSRKEQAGYMGYRAGAKVIETPSGPCAEYQKELRKKGEEHLYKRKGWEGVAWTSYGPFLKWLSREGRFRARTPVYAIGYDWTQSNRHSGLYVHEKIGKILDREAKKAKKTRGSRTQRPGFILITHSMGGLVARAMLRYDEQEKAGLSEKLLGVIHGVQPVHGTPVAYRQLVTGVLYKWGASLVAFLGSVAFSKLLGETSTQCATLLSKQRGFTELLPNQLYEQYHRRFYDAAKVLPELRGGEAPGRYYDSPWLTYSILGKNQAGKWIITKSKGSDSINKYRLYDAYRSKNQPPGLAERAPEKLRKSLRKRLRQAEAFHYWLNNNAREQYKHKKTWAFFGWGFKSDVRSDIIGVGPGSNWDEGVCQETYPGGDKTGSAASEAALFHPIHETKYLSEPSDFERLKLKGNGSTRQFGIRELDHEPAYRDKRMPILLKKIIDRILWDSHPTLRPAPTEQTVQS